MKTSLLILSVIVAAPALADEFRQLDSHEHGVGSLNIAIDGKSVFMEFFAPGADIVGFEHEAKSDADKEKVDAALKVLNTPLDLFVPSPDANCSVVSAKAELEGDTHKEHGNDEHDHSEHKGHEKRDHDDHNDQVENHTEFQATYALTCENPTAMREINFSYFDSFPNAQEVEVQLVTASGAKAYEVEKDSPLLTIAQQ